MTAGIGIKNIDGFDRVIQMLLGIGAVNIGNTRIKTAAEYRHQSLFLETIMIGPLPAVLEMCLVRWFIIGGIKVINPTFETGIHNGQILIRQRDIDDQFRAALFYQGNQFRHTVGIDLGGLHLALIE